MKYNIIYKYLVQGKIEKEVVDEANNRKEANFLVKEYKMAFNTNMITIKKIRK
tara:strand:- start:209 stop:367 length:159 start_codon:yes stop_codon:yes gene_type:complete